MTSRSLLVDGDAVVALPQRFVSLFHPHRHHCCYCYPPVVATVAAVVSWWALLVMVAFVVVVVVVVSRIEIRRHCCYYHRRHVGPPLCPIGFVVVWFVVVERMLDHEWRVSMMVVVVPVPTSGTVGLWI